MFFLSFSEFDFSKVATQEMFLEITFLEAENWRFFVFKSDGNLKQMAIVNDQLTFDIKMANDQIKGYKEQIESLIIIKKTSG